jgi:signal transduction histidine kinase
MDSTALARSAMGVEVAPTRPVDLRLLRGVLFVLTAGVVVIGLRAHVRGGITSVNIVAFVLTVVWAVVGLVASRPREGRSAQSDLYGVLASVDALLAALALSAGRMVQSEVLHPHGPARSVATLAALGVTAVSFQLLLALPDGHLVGGGRRFGAGLGYAAALGVGLFLVVRNQPLSLVAGGISWSIAALGAVIPLRARYEQSVGHDRERLQWFGSGIVLAACIALTVAVLHALINWPRSLGEVAAASTALIPLSLLVSDVPATRSHGGRTLVRTFALFGLVAMVSAIYLVVVVGLGHKPSGSSERTILGLSMLATALAAAAFIPTRARLTASATRFVYGAREAPDEVVRTFGSRLTRAIPMDELLLQLAESLRKTMALTSAEIYTGMGEVLERAVSVPDLGPRSIVISQRERPVVTRAGVSGNAWASVWLPTLMEGRDTEQVRVAPISHAGELLGLVVVERPVVADSFTEDDDRVLTDLARQVGLAFHNSQLDTALQTTLDELRRQADELRESRARVVASGDAERRKVERNLHDGAQQHLVALAVNLRLAKDVIIDDPAAGAEMVEQLVSEVQATIQELRELAHGIYPPLLVDSGLVEALRAAANRNPLPVDLVAEDIGRYSAETEAAVYFCCLEALQNAAKHAPEATVEVRLWEESGGLLFEVTDNGPGYDADLARKGHGYVNMSDRLGAIGGTVRWESELGHGSHVRGTVPLLDQAQA